jgi:5-methylcytosine-specific restriction endonuclease McrA
MVRDLEAFKVWLGRRGAEVLATTNPYEVLRVRTSSGVHVVHKNRRGNQTWPAPLSEIVDLYLDGGSPRLSPTAKTRRSSRLKQRYPVLVARDGCGCFFCGVDVPAPDQPTPPDFAPSVEHLVNIAHGGPNHISNAYLAHTRCNNIAGDISAVEKIRLREKMRGWL